jgi:hypothetical protein
MSRPKRNPVDRALDAYLALTAHEMAVFEAVVKRLGEHGNQKGRSPRRPKQKPSDANPPRVGAPVTLGETNG